LAVEAVDLAPVITVTMPTSDHSKQQQGEGHGAFRHPGVIHAISVSGAIAGGARS
jgi:hypothetical protein